MIKTASKAEVQQVAYTLIDPILGNIRDDMQNLRAQMGELDRSVRELRREFENSVNRMKIEQARSEKMRSKILGKIAALENRVSGR